MPLDKHNSRTAGARDLISSLTNVASSWDVPFDQPQLLQCLHQGATFVSIFMSRTEAISCLLQIFTLHSWEEKNGRSKGYRWDTSCAMPCLLCYVWVRIAEIEIAYRDMGRSFYEYILRIFRNGWIDCRDIFHAVLCLCNNSSKAEYEANWLISVLIINYWGIRQLFFPAKRYYTQIKQLKLYYVFKKVNKQV